MRHRPHAARSLNSTPVAVRHSPSKIRDTAFRSVEGLKRLRAITNARGFRRVPIIDPFAIRALLPRRVPSMAQLMFLPRVLTRAQRWILPCALTVALASGYFWFERVTAPWRIQVPAVGGSYTEGVIGAPKTLNPLFAPLSTADLDVARLVYTPLFSTDLNTPTIFVPQLATGFSTNDERTVYTVPIRTDFHWQDGVPVTIDDVLFTIERIQDPAIHSPFAAALAGMTATKRDEKTLTFTLSKPSSTFLASLTWAVLPQHRWNGRTNWQEMDPQLVGSGPFAMKSIERADNGSITSVVLERFPASPAAPNLQTLSLKFFPNAASALSALDHRQIDGLLTTDFDDAQNILKRRTDISATTLALPQYTALFFNPKEQTLFSDPAVRRALVAALPVEAIVSEAFRQSAAVAHGIFTPEIYQVSEPTVPPPDAHAADRMLTQAGFPLKNGVRINAQKKVLRFTVTTPDVPTYVAVANAAAAAWKGLGAQVNVNPVNTNKLFSDVIRPRAYDVLLFDQNLSADPDPFAFWHSSQMEDPGLNLALWHNSAGDDLIDRARGAADPELRRALYAQLEEILKRDAPAAILAHPKTLYITAKKIHGLNLAAIATPDDRFATVAQWYSATKSKWTWRRNK